MLPLYRARLGLPLEIGLRAIAHRTLADLPRGPELAQATLRGILEANGGTAWGRRWGLAGRDPLAAFRALPPTTYHDYAPYIERMASGEPRVLTAERPVFFAATSGSTGKQKLIPVTPRQSRHMRRAMVAPLGLALLGGALGPVCGRGLMVLTAYAGGTTPAGIPYAALSSASFAREGRSRTSAMTSPRAVVYLQDQVASRYLHLRFALGERRLWTIISFFPATLLATLRDLQARAYELLRDLADGTIARGLDLPAALRAELSARVRPDPQRARELARLWERGRFTVRDIWPDVRSVLTATGGPFRFYVDQLAPYLGGAQVFSPFYAASEALIGVGLSPRREGYALALRAAYPEFLPLEQADRPDARPLDIGELEPGRDYELLLTTWAGLTRYRLGDVVRAVGRADATPLIEFVERRGQVLNTVGEKISAARVAAAVEAALREMGVALVDYTVTTDPGTTPTRYLLLVEEHAAGGAADLEALAQATDRQLYRAVREYQVSRDIDLLRPLAARRLPPGSFERFRAARVAAGASASQVKVPHVLPDPGEAERLFGALTTDR